MTDMEACPTPRNVRDMIRLVAALQARAADDRGATLLEYVLLVGLIAIAAVLAVALLGGRLSSTYSEVSQSL